MRTEIALIVCSLLLWTCGSSEKTTARYFQDTKALDELVAQQAFKISADWAQPMATNSLNQLANAGLLPPGSTINRINLVGEANYLKVEGDTVSAYLPYFGERQMSGGYNADQGITFKGVPKNFEITKNEKKQRYVMRFQINNKTETYQVNAELFPNLSSTISVNSSQRFVIRYDGQVSGLPE
ncbi:DUF4251 domain-containing protein [Spongiimicrobium sp. 2-473A-2-J]|uniref:DUF4251 domain-containing protein n=1 Tax=Eudoraea algarum TaxID=3417568 RepID=UPI003D3618B2